MRAFVVLGLGFAIATAIYACLPDLDATPPPVVAAKHVACGDGIIEIDAGEQCDPGEAGASGCTSTCAIDCPDGGYFDPASHHCYFTLAGTSALDDAIDTCASAGAHVVSFVSDSEYEAVNGWYAKNVSSAAAFWVGLAFSAQSSAWQSEAPPEPGWAPSNRCGGCFAEIDAGATTFANASDASSTACVGSAPDVPAWFDDACENAGTLNTLCEREPPGTTVQSCSGGICIQIAATSSTYLYVESFVSADDARATCTDLGAHLVVFESREEREQVMRELSTLALGSPRLLDAWVGLHRGDAGTFTWDTGASIDALPNPWGDGEPRFGSAAYAHIFDNAYDSELLHTSDAMGPNGDGLPFVCEL